MSPPTRTLARIPTWHPNGLGKTEDKFERVVDGMHLVELEMPDLLAERSGVEVDAGQTMIVDNARRSSAWTTTA